MAHRLGGLLAASIAFGIVTAPAVAQLRNDLPDPFKPGERWGDLPAGRSWGQVATVEIDRDGKSVWVVDRCASNGCAASSLAPVLKFDPTGKLVASFGAELTVFPHGLAIDPWGNVWLTDADGKAGKGHQVFKFSPKG